MSLATALALLGVALFAVTVVLGLLASSRERGVSLRLPGVRLDLGEPNRELARTEAMLSELRAELAEREKLVEALSIGRSADVRPVRRVVSQPHPPTELIEALALDDCVLFAGAGVAASAGYPTWTELLGVLVDCLEELGADSETVALRQQLSAGQGELVAQILSGRLGSAQARDAVAATLARVREQPSALLASLRDVPFAGVVTGEFSDLVPRAFAPRSPLQLTPSALESAGDALRDRRFFALRLYGSATSPERLCLSFDDYRRTLDESRDLTLFVGALMATRTLLFIGTSLDGVEQFCIASGVRSRGSRTHYALVPAQLGLELEQERLVRRYGVQLLPYETDDDHAAVTAFADELRQATRRRRVRLTKVRPPEQLERIVLENVGPFAELKLEFTRPWNVLLGDNSVGKTTVLRAVALALSGESPETTVAPARLLRAHTNFGRIELTFGGSTYRTVLRRARDRVLAESEQVTPVQSGSWLAVGLSALRGVSRSDSRLLDRPDVVEPASSDILPLLRNDLDTRLDDLKSWIGSHWLRSRDADSPDAARHAQIVETFFAILGRLTPGIELEFRGVDRKDGRLLLRSVDGEISLDDLSLGTSAMIGGIGVLLQRLYEVYPDDPEPERRNALLLVDEIDAHLHPGWQARLLPTLRETFPGLHLLATTHSPLIAVNAAVGELHHLRREGGLIVPQRIDAPLAGWRADQVLTGPAFDLDTTMDQETAGKLRRYRRLQSTAEPAPAERVELEQLARELRVTVPAPHETPEQREASRLLEAWLDERLREALTPERRESLKAEVKAQLARLESLGEEPPR